MKKNNKISLTQYFLGLILIFILVSCNNSNNKESNAVEYSFEFNKHKISLVLPEIFENEKIKSLEFPINRYDPETPDKYLLIENKEKTHQIYIIPSKVNIKKEEYDILYKYAIQKRIDANPRNVIISNKIKNNIFSIINLYRCYPFEQKFENDYTDRIHGRYEYIVLFDSIIYSIVYEFETETNKFNHHVGQNFIESIKFE